MKFPIHPNFRLNEQRFSTKEGLKKVANRLVEDGADYEVGIGTFLLEWLSPNDEIQLKTSGSTGKPKTISKKKQYLVNSAKATADFLGLEEGITALLCLPAHYIAGKMMLVRAITLGWHLDYIAPSSNPLKNLKASYDFSAMVPLQLKNSLKDLSKIATLIVGGAAISADLISALPNNRHTRIFETYGMTETVTHIALKKISTNRCERDTYFETLPTIAIEKDERGCLVINAPRVSKTPVVTNDMVEIFAKNRFRFLGRFDNVINSGGVKLFPERIEHKMAMLVSQRFFIAGLPDEVLGQKLVLVIEGEVDKQVLRTKLDSFSTLDKFERPKAILMVPKFIETPSGKIQRSHTLLYAINAS